MDPLEYFDEEYQNFNNSISDVGSLILQSRDLYTAFIQSQKDLHHIVQSKNYDINQINNILTSFESLIKESKEFISTAEKSLSTLQRQRT